MAGIKDWKLKQEAMRLLFEVHNVNEVVDKLIGIEHDNYDNVYENYSRHWKDHEPSKKYDWFFAKLADHLECQETVSGHMLKRGSLGDFIQVLSVGNKILLKKAMAQTTGIYHREELKAALDAVEPEGMSKTDAAAEKESPIPTSRGVESAFSYENHPHYFPIWIPHRNTFRDIRDALEGRNIDQSLYYQTSGSVARWFRITNSDYDIYHSCQRSLSRLIKSSAWISFVSSDSFHGNVMLGGGGAPSKDELLITSLLRLKQVKKGDGRKINHTLLDTSQFMLTESRRVVARDLRADGWDGSVDLKTIVCDVLNLKGTRALLHPRGKTAAWFLTGGTLGNLDEEAFFSSITKKATKGDWLILGIGCSDDNPTHDFLERLEEEYRQSSVRDFMINPLKAIWSELDLPGTVEDAAAGDRLAVKAVTGDANRFSKVPSSVTVTVNIDLPKYGTVQLLQSTRYNIPHLIEFAEKHRWLSVKGAEFDGAEANFKTIVFEHL
jgi:hypothetical protein